MNQRWMWVCGAPLVLAMIGSACDSEVPGSTAVPATSGTIPVAGTAASPATAAAGSTAPTAAGRGGAGVPSPIAAGRSAPAAAGDSASPSAAGIGAVAPDPSIAGAGAVAGAGTAGVAAVGGSEAPPAAGTSGAEPGTRQPRRAISADFLNQTLSVVDVDKLAEGKTRDDALIGTVDLSAYVPGPLSVAITPDGKTALASVSGGWLRLVGGGDIPAGDGTLVFVDIESLKVTGELKLGKDPMGIAITHDGKHAFVGLMSENYMAYVDIEKRSFERIATGNSWNEELAIDDTGTIGVLTTGIAGDSMSFSVAMPRTHGQTRGLTADAAGVAFFPGTKLAFVLQAPTALTGKAGGYNVVDVSDPSSPRVTDNVRTSGDTGRAYPVTSVAKRKSVVYPSADENTQLLVLKEMGLDGEKAKLVQTIEVGKGTFSYGLSSSPEGLVLSAVGTEHYVAVADLETGKVFTVPWGVSKTGPLDIRYIP